MIYPDQLPELKFVKDPNNPECMKLEGWEDLDNWAMLNHGVWCSVQRMCRLSSAEISDTDRLRFLAGSLLRVNVEIVKQNFKLLTEGRQPKFYL